MRLHSAAKKNQVSEIAVKLIFCKCITWTFPPELLLPKQMPYVRCPWNISSHRVVKLYHMSVSCRHSCSLVPGIHLKTWQRFHCFSDYGSIPGSICTWNKFTSPFLICTYPRPFDIIPRQYGILPRHSWDHQTPSTCGLSRHSRKTELDGLQWKKKTKVALTIIVRNRLKYARMVSKSLE